MAKPIDVKLGEEISEKYNLDVVVVLGIDGKEDRVYTMTFGKNLILKTYAAKLGEKLTRAAGADTELQILATDQKARLEA